MWCDLGKPVDVAKWHFEKWLQTVRTLVQGFFSKFLMGGTQNFQKFSKNSKTVDRQSPTGTKSDGGGTCEKNPNEAKTAHLMQN